MDRQSAVRHHAPQTVNDALLAMNGALREHKDIAVDATGDLQPGHTQTGNTDFRTLFTRLFVDRPDPGAALHEKMVAEVCHRLEIDGERAAYIVNKRIGALPEIRTAIDHRDLARIEERWSRLASELTSREEEAHLVKRNADLADIMQGLPVELALSNLTGHVSELSRPFSEEAQADILDACRALASDPADAGTGLSAQFVADASRSIYIFVDDDGRAQVFNSAPAELVIAGLRNFARDDQVLAGSLSKLANQRASLAVANQLPRDFPTPAGEPHAVVQRLTTAKVSGNEECVYRLERLTDGAIVMTNDYYSRPHLLYMTGSGRSVPVNRWEGWDGPPGPENFGKHTHCVLKMSELALRDNQIDAEFAEPPYAEFRICIAWQQLEAQLTPH